MKSKNPNFYLDIKIMVDLDVKVKQKTSTISKHTVHFVNQAKQDIHLKVGMKMHKEQGIRLQIPL